MRIQLHYPMSPSQKTMKCWGRERMQQTRAQSLVRKCCSCRNRLLRTSKLVYLLWVVSFLGREGLRLRGKARWKTLFWVLLRLRIRGFCDVVGFFVERRGSDGHPAWRLRTLKTPTTFAYVVHESFWLAEFLHFKATKEDDCSWDILQRTELVNVRLTLAFGHHSIWLGLINHHSKCYNSRDSYQSGCHNLNLLHIKYILNANYIAETWNATFLIPEQPWGRKKRNSYIYAFVDECYKFYRRIIVILLGSKRRNRAWKNTLIFRYWTRLISSVLYVTVNSTSIQNTVI